MLLHLERAGFQVIHIYIELDVFEHWAAIQTFGKMETTERATQMIRLMEAKNS